MANAQALEARKGVVRIKLQENAARSVGLTPRVKSNGMLSTGVSTLDIAVQKVRATSIRRVFPYAPQFEEQMARHGLDRWYEVTFDETTNPLEAQRVFGQTAGVQVATAKVPMVLKEGNGSFKAIAQLSNNARPSTMPFNDSRLPSQWHYNNTGALSLSQAGADINLFEAWETCTGNKDVIVAIIDGGIDLKHEDLSGNIKYNSIEYSGEPGKDDDGNGYIDDIYGWNFCTNSNEIYPHAHGTHVAGTVGAVNNNSIGVCGIAGGNGSPNSGVKMLSCQVFDSRLGSGEGDFAAAVVYAANCGASIANCSWGWSADGYFEQDVIDAIDYFVDPNTKANRNNLSGGVMFFASGNDGATGNFYPACYDKVISVGSMSFDYTMAPYSNYGSWVDIAAPGGVLDYGEAGGVLSTLPNNQYGFNEGTSMATPHVTGIAALVVSQHGNSSVPAETIRQQIITSVNDIYPYNPGKEGLHGAGYIDAAKALVMGDGTAPEAVDVITALPAQDNITLGWIIPSSSDNNINYHIIYYSTEAFTSENNITNTQSKIVDTKFNSSGDSVSYELGGLQPLTTYYIAIQAVNRWGDKSPLSPVVSATTNAGPKMSVDKTSLSLTVNAASSMVDKACLTISNLDEGLLKWSAYTRTKKSTIATYSNEKTTPGFVTPYSGKLGIEPFVAKTVFKTADFKPGDYPKYWKYFTEYYASIGDSDLSLPNSMAQWFSVDKDIYPDGFNLTAIQVTSYYGELPIIQIYKGEGSMTAENLLQEVQVSYFYSDMIMALNEQIYFAPGESFWIAIHFPPQEKAYPLGMATATDAKYAEYSYMSNDMGKTWTKLANALKGSPYQSLDYAFTWAIKAVSQNPDWSTIMTINPAEGQVKYNETQEVEIANDGQPLINGTYTFNLHFNTNESETNTSSIPVTMTVNGNMPTMIPAKIIDFGSLLVGQSKTITIEVINEGYGLFGYSGSLSGNHITCNSEHFKAPTYIQGGFPARASQKFDVTFEPKAAGSHSGTITFTHSDNKTVFNVTLTGMATDPAKIVIKPDTINLGVLDVDSVATVQKFTIKNDGKYPLEYVFPKFSDLQLENQDKSAHRFGYITIDNLNGSTQFKHDGNLPLINVTDVTSHFTDDNFWTQAIPLGFQFPFYGKNYEYIYINSFGGVAFNLNKYTLWSPITESSERIAGCGYISAYGYQLQFSPESKVVYAKQNGKFVISYQNVMGLVYDTNYTPISFHIVLSPNGDIEIFYDNYNATKLFQEGSTLYCGIVDPQQADALTVTSADIADYWENNNNPIGDRYKQFSTGAAIKFIAPKASFITSLTNPHGIINPGESIELEAGIKANESMVTGETFNNLIIMSNDPINSTSYIRFNASIKGAGLKPAVALEQKEISFGKVFRTSDTKLPLTIKNIGKDTLTVNEVCSATSSVYFDSVDCTNMNMFKIPAESSKDVIIIIPTDNESKINETAFVKTDAGELSLPIHGEVIGCPTIELNYAEIIDTIASGAKLVKPLSITNNGDEELTYSIKPNPGFIAFTDDSENASVNYSYAVSIDDSNIKFEWIDIETTGLGSQNNFTYYNNNDFATVELPFEFPFYGKKYSEIYIYNTGFISFTKREDQKMWPEPPADFPTGSIYTNIIAPYWGMHTMDSSKSAGTYHYVTNDQAVISWMEYGNTMNIGVCYQLILNKDGSFKFQYKEFDDNAIIFNTFGLAGICNEGGTQSLLLADRYIAFNNAIQFYPIVQSTIAAGQEKTIDINVLTNKMAGVYESEMVINNNVPYKEKITIPLKLNITGNAEPSFPTDTIIEKHVAGYSNFNDPLASMGAGAYDLLIDIKNNGTATFNINYMSIECDTFAPYPEYPDNVMPLFQYIGYYGLQYDGQEGWSVYYGDPITIDNNGLKIAIPVSFDISSVIGEYPGTLILEVDGIDSETIKIPFKVIVTDVPQITLDKPEIYIKNVQRNFIGCDSLLISNTGKYDLTYEIRLDPTGKGEEPEEDFGGGIAPMSGTSIISAKQINILRDNLNTEISPLEVTDKFLNAYDTPSDFKFNRALYYPSIATTGTYAYGTGNTYTKYKAATYYVAPEDGFNISHIYTATTLTNQNGSKLSNVDLSVEIINGDDYENGQVIGSGSIHIDNINKAQFVIIPLDRSVYINPGQDFYVIINYPAGIDYPAYISLKEESVVSNRYMGWVEGYGWFDVASMFKEDLGSCGYIMSCLETVEGAGWVKILNPDNEKSGILKPGKSLNVKFEFNATNTPIDKNNKAMLIIKSDDPSKKIINIPIQLDLNSAPVINVPSQYILAQEGSLTTVNATVIDTENDNFTIRIDDSGNMSSIVSISALNNSQAIISPNQDGSYSVSGASDGIKLAIGITPPFESAGDYTLTITATDNYDNEAQQIANYTVVHTNRAPIASTLAPITIMQSQTSEIISFADFFTDPDGDELIYRVSYSVEGIVSTFLSGNNAIFAGDKVGKVYVTISAIDPANASATAVLEINVTEYTGIEGISINALVDAYPNPVVETLYVTCDFNCDNITYSIYDVNGALIYNESAQVIAGSAKSINMANLSTGLYILKIATNNGIATYPIIKK